MLNSLDQGCNESLAIATLAKKFSPLIDRMSFKFGAGARSKSAGARSKDTAASFYGLPPNAGP